MAISLSTLSQQSLLHQIVMMMVLVDYFFHFSQLVTVYPQIVGNFEKPTLVLAVGSTGKLVFKGGPQPWHGKPSGHFKQSKLKIKVFSNKAKI